MLEINPVPLFNKQCWLWGKFCKSQSLNSTKVKPGDLDVCHRMEKKDKVITKFKNRKQIIDIIFKQKELVGATCTPV